MLHRSLLFCLSLILFMACDAADSESLDSASSDQRTTQESNSIGFDESRQDPEEATGRTDDDEAGTDENGWAGGTPNDPFADPGDTEDDTPDEREPPLDEEDTTPTDETPTDEVPDVEPNPDAGEDDEPITDTSDPEDTTEPQNGLTPPPMDVNASWIGGACTADFQCEIDGGWCVPDADGFPNGHCTTDCDLYCPDQDGAVTTFCIDPYSVGLDEPMGLCAARCDFGVSSTGCREGYQCVPMPRHNQPSKVVYTCVPGDDQPFELSACHEELIARGIGFEPAINPMDHPEGKPHLTCNVTDPIWVDGIMNGIAFRYAGLDGSAKRIFTSCPLALAMEETTALVLEHEVTDIIHLGVYNCRVISGTDTLSEHGLANAIDISAISLDDGAYFSVLQDWEKGVAFPSTNGGSFLKWFAETLHEEWIYNIILTPEFNAAHADHFHCDLTAGSYFLE